MAPFSTPHETSLPSEWVSIAGADESEQADLEIIRGPYLQKGTAFSIVIRWATNNPVQGKIWYGWEPKDLSKTLVESNRTCDHHFELEDLVPDQLYFYAVGTIAGLQAEVAPASFVTAPAPTHCGGTIRPLRIWVLGDAGRGNDLAAQVRDGYQTFTGTRHTDLWLMLGDNAYETGTLAEYQQGIFDTYPQFLRQSVLWTAIGNHDAGCADSASQSGPYYDLFTVPTQGEAGGVASGTAAYYSFDWGNIHFICLDSYGSDRAPTGAMFSWLRQDLAATEKVWRIAFWHHPPYSKGSHDSDTEIELIEMRQHALPILEAAGIDLVLAGHSHAYERTYLIDGHYGDSSTFTPAMKKNGGSGRISETGAYRKSAAAPHAGTVYIVAGTSSYADIVLPHPAMHTSLSIPGSLVLDVQGGQMDITFIDVMGQVLDTFTLEKIDISSLMLLS